MNVGLGGIRYLVGCLRNEVLRAGDMPTNRNLVVKQTSARGLLNLRKQLVPLGYRLFPEEENVTEIVRTYRYLLHEFSASADLQNLGR